MTAARLITISIPVLNEEHNIPALLARLRAMAETLAPRYAFEFLFTDNHSQDRTFEVLAGEAAADARIRVLRFSRNFGFQKSILTNYLHARGDAAIQIDADLQDPPEMIAPFLDAWERGYKVVYGIRKRRREAGPMRLARKVFYRLIARLSEYELPVDAGDFRLIDRTIIEHLRGFHDQAPYLRGMIATLGYAQIGIPYDREARKFGLSKFRLRNLVQLGMDGIVSQSTKPLRYITYFGFVTSAISLVAAAIYVLVYLFGGFSGSPGFTTLVLLLLIQLGLTSAFLGILGEYIGRIFANVRGAPTTIVDQRIEPPAAAAPETRS